MKTTMMIAVALVATQLTASACAPVYRDGRSVAGRQEYQRDRIEEGVDEGDLTHREARRLRERSRDIAQERREARQDDGRIDSHERRELRHDQNRLSDQIYNQRHDDQVR
jgi:hypothetical protein